MITILIDTNVVLDILLHRQDYPNAKTIFTMAAHNRITGFISTSAITDFFFLSKNDLGKKPAKDALKDLLQIFKPATVTDDHIFQALDLDWNDFEDSVQYTVGESLAVDYIVTRNTQDYTLGTISAVTPQEFIEIISE